MAMSRLAITVLVCGLMGLGWLGCGIVTAQNAMRRGGGGYTLLDARRPDPNRRALGGCP